MKIRAFYNKQIVIFEIPLIAADEITKLCCCISLNYVPLYSLYHNEIFIFNTQSSTLFILDVQILKRFNF